MSSQSAKRYRFLGRCPGFSRGSHTPNCIVSPWRLEHLEHWTTAAWSSANFTCVSGEPSRPSGRTPPDGSVAAAPRQPSRASSSSKPRLLRRSASAASNVRSRTRPGPDQSPLPAPADLGHVEKVRNGLLLLILHVAVPQSCFRSWSSQNHPIQNSARQHPGAFARAQAQARHGGKASLSCMPEPEYATHHVAWVTGNDRNKSHDKWETRLLGRCPGFSRGGPQTANTIIQGADTVQHGSAP